METIETHFLSRLKPTKLISISSIIYSRSEEYIHFFTIETSFNIKTVKKLKVTNLSGYK